MILNIKGKKIEVQKGDLLSLRDGKTVIFDSVVAADTPMVFVQNEKGTEPYPIPMDEIENVLQLVKQTLSLFERIVQTFKRLFGKP